MQSAQPHFVSQSFRGSHVDFRGRKVHNNLALLVVRGGRPVRAIVPRRIGGRNVRPSARGSGMMTTGTMTSSATRATEPTGLDEYLDRARRRVEWALTGYLPEVDPDPSSACPARLAMAMRHSVLGGGKRLRPVLCLMAAEACGGDRGGGAAGGLCAGDGAHLLADPRRPAGDGRRRPAAGPADLPQGVRRGDGDPGRGRPA